MAATNDLIVLQRGSDTAPSLSGYDEVTNPLHPPQRLSNRFSHFADGVYDLSPESHLAKLMKVLLGDVGVGQLHKRMLLVRLQQVLGGTHFFDLDALYGHIFGVNRRAAEQLALDPFRQNVTQTQWDQLRVRDGSYRSRGEQFARAVNFGCTVGGIEQAAEAILSCDCEVREGWATEDIATRTWANVEAIGTYGTIETSPATWFALEQQGAVRALGGKTRHLITIIPKRDITAEERFDVIRVLERLKPAGSVIEVIAQPPQIYTKAVPSVARADSEHWEIRTQIGNTPIDGNYLYRGDTTSGYIDSPTTPWSAYQGEAWTLLTLNPAVVVTTVPDGNLRMDTQFSPSAQDLPNERYVLPTGEGITFLSKYALKSLQSIFAGRLTSEGVLSVNPYSGTRDQGTTTVTAETSGTVNTGFTTAGTANIDGADLPVMASLDALQQSTGRQSQLYWTSPLRAWDSPAVDVVEVRFPTQQTITLLNLEIAHYPHQFEVHSWDRTAGVWRTVFSMTVRDSVPFSVNGALPSGALHPYHFGENHWLSVKERIGTTKTDIMRFVFKRQIAGNYPLAPNGQASQYPLALRNVDLGFRLTSLDGVVPPVDTTTPLVTSTNAVGQPTKSFVTTYPAKNVLGSGESVWKSQPQPVADAVVNLYLDMRSSAGLNPTVDRFFIDPLTSGPSFNLYWSAGAPQTDLSIALPLDTDAFPTSIVGNLRTFFGGDGGLLWPQLDNAWIDFDNADLQLNPNSQSWWVGASMVALSPANTLNHATLLSFGAGSPVGDVAISFDASVLRVTWGATSFTVPAVFATGDRVDVLVSFKPQTNGQVIMNAWVSVEDGATTTATATFTPGTAVVRPSSIRWGHSASTVAAEPFPFRLIGANIHYGDGTAQVNGFFANPATYRQIPLADSRALALQLGVSEYDPTLGALLRFDPGFMRPGVSLGFIGGQPDIYGSMSWFPIARDYTLRKGMVKVPPTAAAIWKFEFTGLVAEPYETFLAIPRTVKLFTDAAQVPGSGGVTWDDNLLTALSAQSVGRFTDMAPITLYQSQYLHTAQPTLGITAPDPQSAASLRDRRGFPYNAMPWQSPSFIGQQVYAGTHRYKTSQVDHINKVGFFVGLRQLVPFRVDYSQPENVTTYLDLFWDLANLTTSGMTMLFDSNKLYTPANAITAVLPSPRTVTSRVFASYVPVEAVQFATQQSEPVSILYDTEFHDPGLPTATFADTSGWHYTGDAHMVYDTVNKALKVTRNPDLIRTLIGTNNPVIHPPITPVFTTSPTWTTALNSASQGGIASGQVPVSPGGALHVAVRLTPLQTLSQPLYLQLIGSDATTVLSETPFTPQPNTPTEQTLHYLLGQQPALEASVEIRLVQKGAARDEWLMHSFALFDDSVLWEFSNDGGITWQPAVGIRNNADGALRFPSLGCGLRFRLTAYRYNTSVSMIKIKPWYTGRALGRHALPQRGANLSSYDDDMPIQQDPDFTAWTDPIPRSWYAKYKPLLIETTSQYGDSLFAKSYSRTATQASAATVVDTATSQIIYVRGATQPVGVGDAATRTITAVRGATEPITVKDSGHKVTWETLAGPPVDPVI